MGDVACIAVDVHDARDRLPRVDARNGLDPDRLVGRLPLTPPVSELIVGDPRAALRDLLQHAAQELPDFRRRAVQARRPRGLAGDPSDDGRSRLRLRPRGEHGDEAPEQGEGQDQV